MRHVIWLAHSLDLPLEAVTQTFALLGVRGSGKTHAAVVLVEQIVRAGQRVAVLDPLGVWWGLRAGADGGSAGLPVVIAGGDHGDVPLEPASGGVMADFVVWRARWRRTRTGSTPMPSATSCRSIPRPAPSATIGRTCAAAGSSICALGSSTRVRVCFRKRKGHRDMKRPTKGYGAREIERFNSAVPIGTRVRYWPVLPARDGMPAPLETVTRSVAWALGHGDGVVLIVGQAGGVLLSHVELLP